MKKGKLSKLVDHLEEILEILTDSKIEDSWIRKTYAEYLIAFRLASQGHKVQICNERDVRNADIYLPDIRKRVEVKSGLYEEDEYGIYVGASFGKGTQITKEKFDYCAFVTFDQNQVRETFLFEKEELKEVGKPRPKIAGFPKTNPCLLLFYKKLESYQKFIGDLPKYKLQAEYDLNKHPQKYKNRWNIIGR